MGDALDEILERSRDLGFLGPGPLEEQRHHAEAFRGAVFGTPERAIDLGSGGGVPGLVLAWALPHTTWVLLDAMSKRTAFLEEAVSELGMASRVAVWTGRAEQLVLDARAGFDLAVARGFGPPSATAEAAAPFLRLGGQLVVSEPPGSVGARWPADGIRQLGLTLEAVLPGPPSFVRLRAEAACPEGFPRAVGRLTKRPLFHVEQGR